MAQPKDWERIEFEYRAGQFSVREIGKRHGVSEGAIRKRAKAANPEWIRDLGAQVAAAVRATLIRETPNDRRERTEAEVIADSAATQVDVLRGHRTRITRMWAIASHLETALMDAVKEPSALKQLAEQAEAQGLVTESQVRRLNLVLCVDRNAAAFGTLANAMKTVIGLERQAFGIRDEDNDTETYEQRLERLGGEQSTTEGASA